MRRWVLPILVTLAFIVGGGVLWSKMSAEQNVLRLSGQTYQLAILRTEAEITRGLSGTDNLPENQAVLFVFPRDDTWGMWMKDMKYSIDIVWLNKDKKVVYTVKNAQPSSYPKTIFKSDVNSRYVIELPSGTIERTGIKNGDQAEMPSGV